MPRRNCGPAEKACRTELQTKGLSRGRRRRFLAAAFMIRDGSLPGGNISILEAAPVLGGSLDGGGNPVAEYSRRLDRPPERPVGRQRGCSRRERAVFVAETGTRRLNLSPGIRKAHRPPGIAWCELQPRPRRVHLPLR